MKDTAVANVAAKSQVHEILTAGHDPAADLPMRPHAGSPRSDKRGVIKAARASLVFSDGSYLGYWAD